MKKRPSSLVCWVLLALGPIGATSCKSDVLLDGFQSVPRQAWVYADKPAFRVKIGDAERRIPYQLKLNLRLTKDYSYTDLYILVHETGPDHQTKTKRVGLKVADKDGRWLGRGVGSLFSYRICYDKHYQFPDTGVYEFQLEQNMRDNPLRGISDVGLAIIPDKSQ